VGVGCLACRGEAVGWRVLEGGWGLILGLGEALGVLGRGWLGVYGYRVWYQGLYVWWEEGELGMSDCGDE
jgi:hypothetical protein